MGKSFKYWSMAMSDKLFKKILKASAWIILSIVCVLFLTLFIKSLPAIFNHNIKLLTGTVWDPGSGEFGALIFIIGTLITSFLALLISLPFALAISVCLAEFVSDSPVSSFLRSVVELLAGIPSVIYGFWGIFIIVPIVRQLEIKMGVMPYGVGIFTAAVILAIMIIPYSASIMGEAIRLVPHNLREASYSLGSTKYETIRYVVLPYAKSGVFAGVLLSLGRALGETMAVTMVIGNYNFLPKTIFSPSNTIASVIANEFTEAIDRISLSTLIELGLFLFLVTAVINMAGKYVINRTRI
ncbi:phosphate ABC transporter permease subunit PstC [bacterium]|nr:phosphate ABC transporter permease subunit PstC [bacterium]